MTSAHQPNLEQMQRTSQQHRATFQGSCNKDAMSGKWWER